MIAKKFVVFVLLILLSGCAGLSIPAPDAPVKPFPEPPIRNSVITVPVTFSLDSILNDLGFSTGQGETGDRIAESIRRFLKRQAMKNETRIVQTRYVRDRLGRAWDSLQNPVRLENGLSLLLSPQAVSVSVLPDQTDDITLIVGVTAKPKLVAGDAAPSKRPLPEISIAPAPPRTGFHIALETELSFDALGAEMTKRLAGRVFTRQGNSVTIRKVRAYGSGESVVLAMNIKGSIDGVLYLAGIPAYDRETRSLFIRDLDYTIETSQVLAKAADWLRHSGLQESLAKKAVWHVGDRIDAARDAVSAALTREINDQVSVGGKVDSLQPVSVGITDTALKAVVEAEGTVNMKISGR